MIGACAFSFAWKPKRCILGKPRTRKQCWPPVLRQGFQMHPGYDDVVQHKDQGYRETK